MKFQLGLIMALTLANVFRVAAEETHSAAVIEDLFAAPLPDATHGPTPATAPVTVDKHRIEGNAGLPPADSGRFMATAGESHSPAVVEYLFAAPLPVATNGPAQAGGTFKIDRYRIEGNTVLPPGDFGMLSNYTGTSVQFPEVREGLGKLQLRYRELGFPTISVALPQQRLSNGVVRLKIVEGTISDIVITGNRYYSTNNIRRALPGLTTNILLNTKWFQPELDQANENRDRQIYPVIAPGPDPGTTELTLKVKDQLPLHGRLEINDKATPGTALLRADTAIQYANLWQLEHVIGFDYNFSPQAYKSEGEANGFAPDLPQVATVSGFYRMPLGTGSNLREQAEQHPANFGYDEVDHKFSLPPPSGHPDLTLYASHSSSDTTLAYGPVKTIFSNTLAEISQQDVSHTPSVNDNVGLRLNVPLQDFWSVKSSLSFGLDYKGYDATTDYTNQTLFSLYALDSFGNRVLVTNQVVALAKNSSESLYYFPLSFGWAATRPDRTGGFQFVFSDAVFLESLASGRSGFQSVAGNSHAGGNYTTVNASLTRQQNLPGDWSLVLNASGQWATSPLIGNEQFELGGSGGVRGYQEGEAYGDTGWRFMCDVRTPPVNVGYFPTATGDVPAELRCSGFFDYGDLYFIDRGSQPTVSEAGSGFGAFLTAGEHFDARLTIAWALLGSTAGGSSANNYIVVHTAAGTCRAYFSVGYQF